MSNVSIPHDLVPDILLRLPLKSLMRFKCVSKSWCRIIDDPDFLKTRLNKSKSNMKIIAVTEITGCRKLKLYDADFTLGKFSNMKQIKLLDIMGEGNEEITFAGSCNGLVCVVYSKLLQGIMKEIIVLWNPSTRKHVQLPKLPIEQYKNTSVRTYEYTYYHAHGFGYDHIMDDYKVVQLVQFNILHHEFSIFSLKSNEWKTLKGFTYRIDLNCGHNGVFANGALHWMLNDYSVLAFDLGTEKFHVLLKPETLVTCPFLSVAFVSGCQYLIYDNKCGNEKWIMKDYGSWTELTCDLSIGMQLLIKRPWSCFNNIEMYNFKKESFEKVKEEFEIHWIACPYFENLFQFDANVEKIRFRMKKKKA